MIRATLANLASGNLGVLSASIGIQIIGYMISLALMPLAIAFYTPEEFGRFAAVFFAANLIGGYGGLRLEWAVINEKSNRNALYLVAFGCTLVLVWVGLFIVATIASPSAFFRYFDLERWDLVWAAPMAAAIGYGLFQQSYGIRAHNFREIYLARNTTMVSRQAYQILFGWLYPSLLSICVSEILSRISGNILFSRAVSTKFSTLPAGHFARRWWKNVSSRYAHYTQIALPSSLLNFGLTEGLGVVLLVVEGAEAGGSYWLVMRLFGLPMALIGSVVGDVLQGQMAKERDRRVTYRNIKSAGLLLTVVAFVFLPAGAVLFWWLTSFLYDGRWAVSGVLALILVPAICIQFIASPLSRSLVALEKMQYKFIFDVALLISVCVWVFLKQYLHLDLIYSMAVLSVVQVISYSIYLYLSFWVVRVEAKRSATTPAVGNQG